MGIGLQWAGANDAMAQSVRQRIMDQIAAEQRAKADTQQQFDNSLRERQFQSNEELKQAQLAALVEQRQGQEADRQAAGDIRLGDTTPPGQMSPNAPAQLIGRLQRIGQIDDSKARPAVDVGPLQEGDTGMARGVLKLASSSQQKTQDEADARVEAARLAAENKTEAARALAQSRTHEDEQKAKDRLAQIAAAAAAAAARPVADKLTKVEHKGPDGKTIVEWLPQSEIKGKTFEKGTNAATENRLASAQAVSQTGDDIIAKLSDPAVAKNLGVAMGRFSNLQDFIGNPPPEFSELAGQIESYALANMGVHGMRSAQGADQIKRMLSQPHTPESLIASVRGLNGFSRHFMENEGRATTSSSSASPSPASAVKKFNPATGKVE